MPHSETGDFGLGRTPELYAAYQERLKVLNACDFGDLLLHGLRLFAAAPDILADYQSRFRAILVDEYQDTNVAQYLWLRQLAQVHRNITCVGDDDQSIYSWRGAEVGNILRFEQDFPGARVIRLERNYRSTGHILGAASGLIAHNRSRHGKTLWTEDEAGERVRIASLWDEQEEARFVGEEIEAYQRHGVPLNDMAVLVRAGFQTRAFEERFINLGLPYRVIGGPRFYERAEIRDAIAYLRDRRPAGRRSGARAHHQPAKARHRRSDPAAFAPHRTRQRVQLVRRRACALCHRRAAPQGAHHDHPPARRFRALADAERARAAARPGRDRARGIRLRPDVAGGPLGRGAGPAREPEGAGPGARRVRDPARLSRACRAGHGQRLGSFRRHGHDHDPAQRQGAGVRSSVPAGLGGGPVPKPARDGGGRFKALEEERRLAYVGITRAKRALTISYAANRRIYNQWAASVPARFVEELPAEHTEFLQRQSVPEPAMSGWFDDLRAGGRGPGFHRMRAAGKPAVIEGQARVLATQLPRSKHNLAVGQRIFHEKFGYGEVRRVEGNKLEIAFDKAGTKKVIDSFVAPA